ncbi:actin filament binding protein [Histoplasma capsulatum]|uniref:Actin filament binding protein n=1 Tax=Ajellomyces capsulatus TaxID=5037 RepID=A0A8A1MPP7_AJECA|nr:actin filament binding protein [Histoplasma capsulatum]
MAPLELQGNDDYEAIARAVQPVPRHRSHDPANNQKRTDPFQFGSRYLEEGDDVFEFNAWDHVETDADYREYAELQYLRQKESPVSEEARDKYNANPSKFWNLFYKHNASNFFKNRKWLHQEFPILTEVSKADAGPQVILEVGAGAGNSAFPILANNKNEQLRLHACDYSKKAVEVIRKAEHYDERYMQADVWDVSAEGEDSFPPGLGPDSVDVVVMIFIFSALSPSEWCRALRNIHQVLKPGGHVLFRDYGKGDLAQTLHLESWPYGEWSIHAEFDYANSIYTLIHVNDSGHDHPDFHGPMAADYSNSSGVNGEELCQTSQREHLSPNVTLRPDPLSVSLQAYIEFATKRDLS